MKLSVVRDWVKFVITVNVRWNTIQLIWHVGANVHHKSYFERWGVFRFWLSPLGFCHKRPVTLQWRHNEHDGVSNHQPHVCIQAFFQAQIKENIKVPRHWPLWAEFTGDRWIPRTKGQLRGKCFHLITSSWMWSIGVYFVARRNWLLTTNTLDANDLRCHGAHVTPR